MEMISELKSCSLINVFRADRPLIVRPFISVTKWSKSVIEWWERNSRTLRSRSCSVKCYTSNDGLENVVPLGERKR